jgi:ElaB/YqjD/DUF883 family membrane-anchored ribosome-binding protein
MALFPKARSLFGRAIASTGRAFGLPEMGFSERVSPKPPTIGPESGFGQIQGIQTSAPQMSTQTFHAPLGQVDRERQPTQPTGDGGGGVPTGQPPTEQAPAGPDMGYLESLIQPALDTLSGLESDINRLYGEGGKEAEAFRAASEAKAKEKRGEAVGTVERQEAKARGAAGEAEKQQRRGFAEIAQQFLGKFGRTGFGQGVTGALGETTMQTLGKIRTGLQETVNELNIRRDQIEDIFNSQIQEANFEAENLKGNARSALQSALVDIRSRRATLQAARGEMIADALENYRQTVNAVNQRNTQFQQNLHLLRQETNEKIRQAQASAAMQLEKLPSFTLEAGETQFRPLSDIGLGGATPEQITGFGTQLPEGVSFGTAGQYGVLSKPKEEELSNPFAT